MIKITFYCDLKKNLVIFLKQLLFKYFWIGRYVDTSIIKKKKKHFKLHMFIIIQIEKMFGNTWISECLLTR